MAATYTDLMQRPDCDPKNIQLDDILCDFCHTPWGGQQAMIEGHQGSVICGKCLTVAFTFLCLESHEEPFAGTKCNMCLEDREEPLWESPLYEGAWICRRCARMAATSLDRSKDFEWEKPRRNS